MKRFLFLLLFLIPIGLTAQTNSDYRNQDRILVLNMNEGNTVDLLYNYAYTASTVDTTEWVNLANFANAYLTLQSKDSCTLLINYQLSVDGVALGVSTLLDSLSTASDAGALKTLNFGTTALGATYGRFIFTGSAQAFPEGTTSATYTAKVLLRKY